MLPSSQRISCRLSEQSLVKTLDGKCNFISASHSLLFRVVRECERLRNQVYQSKQNYEAVKHRRVPEKYCLKYNWLIIFNS